MRAKTIVEVCLSRLSKGDLRFRSALFSWLPRARLCSAESEPGFAFTSEKAAGIHSSSCSWKFSWGHEVLSKLSEGEFLFLNPGSSNSYQLTPSEVGQAKLGPGTVMPACRSEESKTILLEELEGFLEFKSWITEAYLEEGASPDQPLVLGVLSEGALDSSKRFELVEEVAGFSELLFGEPGSIEVYEAFDWSNWELFKTRLPFYEPESS